MPVAHRPPGRLRGDPQRQPIPVHLRARVAEVQVRRDHPLLHRQHHLHHAGDAGRRLQVADVGLHRADQQRPVGGPSAPVGRTGGVGLDRVAHLGTGAVRLHVVHVRRRDAGTLQRRLDHALLRRAAGHGQARARPVLVERSGADHGPDPVAVRLRLGQPLQDHDPAALAAHVAVGRGVERLAAPVRRQHAGVGAQLQQSPRQDRMHAAGQRQVGLAALQPRHRLVQRHQRRGAGGVDRHRRSLQPQRERDAADCGVEGGAGDRVEAGGRLGGVAGLHDQAAVLVVADAGVYAGAAAGQPFRVQSRVLQRTPARLQHQALLRVEHLRLDRRDAEERGVEQLQVLEIGAEAAGRAPFRGVGKELADAPDTGARLPLADQVRARGEPAPELGRAVGAGKPARHAHDRDRLSPCHPVSFHVGLRARLRQARRSFRFHPRILLFVKRAHGPMLRIRSFPARFSLVKALASILTASLSLSGNSLRAMVAVRLFANRARTVSRDLRSYSSIPHFAAIAVASAFEVAVAVLDRVDMGAQGAVRRAKLEHRLARLLRHGHQTAVVLDSVRNAASSPSRQSGHAAENFASNRDSPRSPTTRPRLVVISST